MKKRILVFGGSGLVGSTFINYVQDMYEIFYTYNTNSINFSNTTSYKINLLTESKKISTIIDDCKPDIILHTIAYPSVDFCELNHKSADELHVHATQIIADYATKNNNKVIFLSTDAVFNGKLNRKYFESDLTEPVNYYGATKLSAENIILNNSNNTVLRTAVVYGWHPKSRFTNWIFSYLKEGKIVDPFIDQYNTPTLVDDLVQSIVKIIENNVSGLFHAVGKTCTSKYEFAILLAEKFNLEKNLIKSVTSNEKKQDAPRPAKTCLDATKLEQQINFQFSSLKDGISTIFEKSRL